MQSCSSINHDLLRAATTFRFFIFRVIVFYRGSSWHIVLRKSSKSGSKPHPFTTSHTTYGRRTLLRFRNPVKFRLGIVKSQMGIGVQRDADIRVTHDVLQSFRAHAAARHVGTEGVPAYMGCDLRKLYFINAVVLIQDMLEVMLPMEGNHGHLVLVQKQEARIAFDDRLLLRRLSVGDHPAKAFHNLLAHGHIPLTAFGLGVLDDVLHITLALKLAIYPDTLVLEVDVRNGQPAKFGNPQPGIEQDVDSVIVFVVAVILLAECQMTDAAFRYSSKSFRLIMTRFPLVSRKLASMFSSTI